MIYISKSEILRVNELMTLKFGGLFLSENSNLKNPSSLDFLVDAVHGTLFGEELYPTLIQKAALYMYNIISNHVFQDGNKRTGLEIAILFLEKNNYKIRDSVDDQELIDFTFSVAKGEKNFNEVCDWFEKIIEKI